MVPEVISDLLHRHLYAPIEDLANRPSKEFRSQLLYAAADLTIEHRDGRRDHLADNLNVCATVIELLHLGSLIVDDIQDDSDVRRGSTSLHLRYGVGKALASGNWLYFCSQKLIIEKLRVDHRHLLEAMTSMIDTLEAAHQGQAVDLSVDILAVEQGRVSELCDWVSYQKTGSLVGLAMMLGAICADGDLIWRRNLVNFAKEFGRNLQNFDDIGNIFDQKNPTKRLEDIARQKPTWIWSCAAKYLDEKQYESFKVRMTSKDLSQSAKYLEEAGIVNLCYEQAAKELDRSFGMLASHCHKNSASLDQIFQLGERLKNAYA